MRLSRASLASAKKALTRAFEKSWYLCTVSRTDTGLGTTRAISTRVAVSGILKMVKPMETPNEFKDLPGNLYRFSYITTSAIQPALGMILSSLDGTILFDVRGIETSPSSDQSLGYLLVTRRTAPI